MDALYRAVAKLLEAQIADVGTLPFEDIEPHLRYWEELLEAVRAEQQVPRGHAPPPLNGIPFGGRAQIAQREHD